MALTTGTISSVLTFPDGVTPIHYRVTIRAVADRGTVKAPAEGGLVLSGAQSWESSRGVPGIPDGTLTVPNLPLLPQAGILPPEARWRADFEFLDNLRNSEPLASITFALSGNTTWGALVDVSGVSATQTLLNAINAARDETLAAAASVAREQANGTAGLTADGKLYEARIPDRLSAAVLDGRYSSGAASAAAPTWAKVRQNRASVVILYLGDSTGAIDYRDPRKIALKVAAQFPTHTVLFPKWVNQEDTAYAAAETIQTGTGTANAGGPFTITFYNASVSGSSTYYQQSIGTKARIIDTKADLIFFNNGFNEGALSAQNTIDSFQGRYVAFTERLRGWLPNASLICVGQPPAISPNTVPGPGVMEQYARRVQRVCEQRGYGFINKCQAWLDYQAANPATFFTLYLNDGTSPTDGVHPSSEGGDLGADLTWEAIKPRADVALLQTRTIPPSVYHDAPPPNLLINGDFRDLDASTNAPAGFLTVGAPTFSKDITNIFDPSVGYSLRMVSTGAATSSRIYRSASAAQLARLKGRYVSVLVPVRLNNASRTTATFTTYGAVTIDDGVTATRSLYDSHSIGDWVFRVETKLIDPAATTLTVYAYCENITSTGTDVSFGGIYLVEGIIPRKAFSRIKGDPGLGGAAGGAGGAVLDFLSTMGANPLALNTATTQNATPIITVNAGTQVRFRPQRGMTLRKLRWRTGGTVGGNYDLAVLDAAGNRLWSKGSTAWPAANTNVVETVPDLALNADTDYWLVFAADNATSTALCSYAPSTGVLADFWLGLDGTYVHRTKSSLFPVGAAPGIGTASVSRIPVMTLHEA